MNHSSDSSSSKPSLETLLRLKRAERPDDAFWSDFETSLRQKQLAAIIEPKPWWLGAAVAFRKFSFPAVVVTSGAAAVLAFTVIRNGPPAPVDGSSIASATATASAPVMAVVATLPVEIDPIEEIAPAVAALATPVLLAVSEPPPVSVPVQATPDSLDIEPMVVAEIPAALLVSVGDMPTAEIADAGLAADLADGVGEPASMGLPAIVAEFPVMSFEREAGGVASVSWNDERVMVSDGEFLEQASMHATTFAINASAAAQDTATVAAVAAPGSRFERLLSAETQKVATGSNGSFAQVRERVLHHLGGDEELYASVSRLGVGGDRLSLRF